MKAIQIARVGGPEVMALAEIPQPQPQPHEALIAVRAIGVNFIDCYYREGRYKAALPFVNGQEAAGEVVAVGVEVTTAKVGDRVAWANILGAYAEFAAVDAARLVPLPDALAFDQAAAALLQGMTAHYLSHALHAIKAGETALVHAAAGGVGLLLTQMCKRAGARVIATVGAEAKAQLAREAGADEVILYDREDFEAATKRLTDGRGVDVIYDGVGKTTFKKDLHLLRPRGVLALFGAASGPAPQIDPIDLCTHGSLFLTRPTLKDYVSTREELLATAGGVYQQIVDGKLKLRIGARYPLAEAAEAHRDLEGRKTTGKVLLEI